MACQKPNLSWSCTNEVYFCWQIANAAIKREPCAYNCRLLVREKINIVNLISDSTDLECLDITAIKIQQDILV